MNKRKTICIFIPSLGNGGAEKQSMLLAKALQDTHETYLFILGDHSLLDRHLKTVEEENIQMIIMSGSMFSKARLFMRFVKDHDVDVIISHLPSDTIFTGIIGRLAGVKYIFGGLRNAWIDGYKRIMQKYLHNTILDYSISNSHAGKDYLISHGFKEEKTLVMHNGIEVSQTPIVREDDGPIQILTVSRFVPQKDYHTAIQAIAHMLKSYPVDREVHYHIVGYGVLEPQIKAWLVEYGLDGMATIHIKPPYILELFEQADIYLSSSLFEGISNSMMEAMMYSLPMVATDAGDSRYLVETDFNGFLHELKDVEGIAESLYQLVSSHALRLEMGSQSYNRIQDQFSFEAFQRKYLNLIASLDHSEAVTNH